MSEKTRANPKSAYYRRIRKYRTLPDGSRKVDYIAYLGRVDSMSVQGLKQEQDAIAVEHREWKRKNPFASESPDSIKKKSVAIGHKIEAYKIAQVETEKGKKLTKMEKEVILNTRNETYSGVQAFLKEWIDDRYLPNKYGATHGIHKITTDLNELGINVSTTSVQNYIKSKGIWEKREFGRPKKIDIDVEKLIENTESLLQQIEILENLDMSDARMKGVSQDVKREERTYTKKKQQERRVKYGTIPLLSD